MRILPVILTAALSRSLGACATTPRRVRNSRHRRPRNLQHIFCRIEDRQVGLDWCVLYDRRVFQLLKREQRLALAKRTVKVHEQHDGQIAICYQGRPLAWRERHPTTGVLQVANIFAAAAGAALPPAASAAAFSNPALKR